MSERILATVVTYNPEVSTLYLSLQGLVKQGCDVLLVDNGSENYAEIEQQCGGLPSLFFKSLNGNFGLGRAHNIGIKYARTKAYSYILIMDQDSLPRENMVAALLFAHKTKSKNNKVSAVGATYTSSENSSNSFFVRFGGLKFQRYYCFDQDTHGCIEADFLISSGSLISVDAIESIGEMDETLFIDHIDTEWFLRARSRGYKAYGACAALMQHALGESTHTVKLGKRQRNVPQHKPFRYYYIFRNSILLYRRGYADILWKWNDLQRLVMIFVMFGFIKTPRIANLSMMIKGIWHGLRNKSGPLSTDDSGRLEADRG